MPHSSKPRRSLAVPLKLVPLLAAAVGASCASHDGLSFDPCEARTYNQVACDSAVVHRGYYYGGTWYPHVYPYTTMYYLSRYNGFVSGGGRLRTLAPTVYEPTRMAPVARPNVVRGGFGGIGEGHASAGS